MIRRRWPRLLPLGLLAAAGSGLAAIAALRGPDDWQPTDVGEVADLQIVPARGDPSIQFPAAAAFGGIVLRNLFSATRTPPAEALAASDAPTAASRDVALVGIVGTGSGAKALLRDRASGGIEAVGEGGAFRGWSLTAVEAARIRLERDGEQIELELRFAPEDRAGAGAGSSAASPLQPAGIASRPSLPIEPRASDAQGNPRRARRQEERRNP